MDGDIEVGVVQHNHGVFAAHLHSAELVLFGALLLDIHPDRARTGEHHHIHAGVMHQRVACILAVALHHINHARRKACLHEQLDQAMGADGRVFGRLEHHRVAFQQAGQNRPQGDRNREVPGGNARHHTFGLAQDVGVFFGDFALDNFAVRHARHARDILRHVQSLYHIGAPFVNGLAALAGHEFRKGVQVAFNQLG